MFVVGLPFKSKETKTRIKLAINRQQLQAANKANTTYVQARCEKIPRLHKITS